MTGQPDDEPDTSLREAKVGDRFLLCSDGLSDFVGADIIEEILREAPTPTRPPTGCIEVALKASTRDNVTVVVAEVVDADGDDLPTTVAAGRRRGRQARCGAAPGPCRPALPRRPPPCSRGAAGRASPTTTPGARRGRRAPAARRSCCAPSVSVVVAAILVGGGYAA